MEFNLTMPYTIQTELNVCNTTGKYLRRAQNATASHNLWPMGWVIVIDSWVPLVRHL